MPYGLPSPRSTDCTSSWLRLTPQKPSTSATEAGPQLLTVWLMSGSGPSSTLSGGGAGSDGRGAAAAGTAAAGSRRVGAASYAMGSVSSTTAASSAGTGPSGAGGTRLIWGGVAATPP